MKTFLKTLLPLAALLLPAGCFRNDIHTETFQINQLRTQAGAAIIAQSFQQVSGIQEMRPDFVKHTLTVVYNAKDTHLKNIEYAIVKAGFDLPHWPADPADKAKLPEELR